ncbi:MAG: pilus assembly protein PilM [Burkholderiales bacterium]
MSSRLIESTLEADAMGLSLPGLSRSPAPALLGVDLSTHRVKVVELAPEGRDRLRLERYAIEPIEPGAIVDGQIEKPEAVAAALSRAIVRSGSKARNAALALPSSAVIAKRILLPAGLSDEDYEVQVESEASQYIPFAMDEVNLDFQVLGPAEGSSEDVEVLLAASRRERVEDRVALAEMAGLKPMVIDVEPFAARRVIDRICTFLPDQGAGQVLAVFDMGHANTSLMVLLDGKTVFEREQPFGGELLTQEIARHFGLSLEEAEARKRAADLPESYGDDVLAPFLEQAASEVARAIQLLTTSTPHNHVDRIFLAGGVAVTAGLAEAVADRTQVATEILSPFQGMALSDASRRKNLEQDAPALMVACGLAMRRFNP